MNMKSKSTVGSPTTSTDVMEQMAILRDDLNSITVTLGELAQAKGADLTHAAQGRINEAKQKATEGVETARAQAAHLNDQANDFVRTQPAAALGIAAGLGFLIGMLSTRK